MARQQQRERRTVRTMLRAQSTASANLRQRLHHRSPQRVHRLATSQAPGGKSAPGKRWSGRAVVARRGRSTRPARAMEALASTAASAQGTLDAAQREARVKELVSSQANWTGKRGRWGSSVSSRGPQARPAAGCRRHFQTCTGRHPVGGEEKTWQSCIARAGEEYRSPTPCRMPKRPMCLVVASKQAGAV